MRPILFHLSLGDWSFPVYSYVVFAVIAYLAGLAYGYYESKRVGQDPIYAVDLSLIIFVSAFIGARALFVMVLYKKYLAHPLEALQIWEGGFVYFGGLIGAVLAAWAYIRIRKLPLGIWADICAPTAMTALIFGRIGCLLNGCCYGKFAPNLPWGLVYPPDHPALGLYHTKVHPTPAYEALAALVIFIILNVIARRKRFEGEVFLVMVILYSMARFVIEFYRGDLHRGAFPVLGLSTSQGVAVLGVLAASAAIAVKVRRLRHTGEAAGGDE